MKRWFLGMLVATVAVSAGSWKTPSVVVGSVYKKYQGGVLSQTTYNLYKYVGGASAGTINLAGGTFASCTDPNGPVSAGDLSAKKDLADLGATLNQAFVSGLRFWVYDGTRDACPYGEYWAQGGDALTIFESR